MYGVLYTPAACQTSILLRHHPRLGREIAEDLKDPGEGIGWSPAKCSTSSTKSSSSAPLVEITPIPVGRINIQVGKGVPAPSPARLQEEFFAITSGNKPDHHNWLTQ